MMHRVTALRDRLLVPRLDTEVSAEPTFFTQRRVRKPRRRITAPGSDRSSALPLGCESETEIEGSTTRSRLPSRCKIAVQVVDRYIQPWKIEPLQQITRASNESLCRHIHHWFESSPRTGPLLTLVTLADLLEAGIEYVDTTVVSSPSFYSRHHRELLLSQLATSEPDPGSEEYPRARSPTNRVTEFRSVTRGAHRADQCVHHFDV